MPRCEQCPVRAGLTCVGERHDPVCREVAAGRQERIDQLVEIAEASAPDPRPNPHAARRLLMLGCDYRGGPVGCGCNKSVVCLMGKGWPIAGSDAREVYASDCLACVAGPVVPVGA